MAAFRAVIGLLCISFPCLNFYFQKSIINMGADEESDGRTAVPNPYTGPGPDLSGSLLFDKGKRLVYIGISVYILQRMDFYNAILHSPNISHEWFKIGLGATIGTFCMQYARKKRCVVSRLVWKKPHLNIVGKNSTWTFWALFIFISNIKYQSVRGII